MGQPRSLSAPEVGSQRSRQRETLLFFVTLRQIEAGCPALHEAYQRLADLAPEATKGDPRAVILDWLERELRRLKQHGEHQGEIGSQLMKAAVDLGHVLKQ